MIAPLLEMALQPVTEQHRRMRLLTLLTIWWIVIAVTALFLAAHAATSRETLLALAAFALCGALAVRVWTQRWRPDFKEIAKEIEERHSELHALLVTAVEQSPDARAGRLNFLQQRVVDEAIRLTRQKQWLDTVPAAKRIGATLLQFAALAAMLLTFREFASPKLVAAFAPLHPPTTSVAVTPGDATVERGSSLVVLANFQGLVPGEAALIIEPQNQPVQRVKLVKSLNDPVFGGSLPEVADDLKYRIEYAGQATRDFDVRVFDHPRLDRADATLHYPAYTKLPEKTLPDTRRVSAVEGTKLDVAFSLNKPVTSAVLKPKDGPEIPLETDPVKALASLRGLEIKSNQTYELHLVDADGRASKFPAEFIVQALPNRRPEMKFTSPKGDRRVSPIQELTFAGTAWDDFGLGRYGLTVNIAGRGDQEIELGRDTKADERREFSHVLRLEDLGVKPDEMLSWYLWAEDIGPDGELRRTETDMYFGEVRPFEEIYRAGDGAQAEERERQEREQEQNGGGGGEQTQKLAEAQKQVITATWNLQRAEDANSGEKKPSEKYLQDEPVVRDAQGDALTQVQSMKEKATDPKTVAFVEDVSRAMTTAHDKLAEASSSPTPLPAALAAEQAASNALLKLSAHEYEVTKRQQRSQQQGQSRQANQRELDQLEMKDDEQRYETKREATPQQNSQQREQLATLNRLKELAQRQQDINERLEELQAALQEAKTPETKKTLTQQLERLREEEQQLLSDLDESRQKMEESQQQSQLAEERQKLEQTRGEAQRAADAMQRNSPSEALADGARTARQLQEVRDSYRKKSSGQFNDEMREMRNDARELAQSQQDIGEKLAAAATPPDQHSLAEDNQPSKEIAQQLEKQQERLSAITDQLKRVSEEAEPVEPLLAKELYDTLRKTTQAGTDDKLKNAKELAERGIAEQAQPIEKAARGELDDLKKGVERAAESVLGNEAESIRQARNELNTLTQQLDQEIQQGKANRAANPGQPGEQNKVTQNGANRPGEQGAQPSRNGQNPAGQQPGEKASPGQLAQNQRGARPAGQNGQAGQNGRTRQGNAADEPEALPPEEEAANSRRSQGRQQNDQQSAAPGQQNNRGGGEQAGNGAGGGRQPGEQRNSAEAGRQVVNSGERGAEEDAAGHPFNFRETPRAEGEGGPHFSAAPVENDTANGGVADSRTAGTGGGGGGAGGGAMTGGSFVDWSDRLRNVEEMLDSPALRNEAARIREVAKGVRVAYKKNHAQPDWDMVEMQISAPLTELRNRLSEELAKRDSKESLVPIDRDPVPPKYAERVRSYYEELGRSK